MSIRKHMEAFDANQRLIDAQADSFRNNPVGHGAFETNEAADLDHLGLVHSAVSSSLRQLKSDLNALSQVHHDGASHDHHPAHGEDAHGSETADKQ